MTIQKSFSENKGTVNKRFFNVRYFKFQLKTGWPLFVAFISIFILSMVIPTVNYITDNITQNLEIHGGTFETIKNNVIERLYRIGVINIIISMGCGVLCGLAALKFTNNKVAVNFYHSLPVRRESIFITSTLQNFLYYVVAFALGLVVMVASFVLRYGVVGFTLLRPIVLTFGYGVLFFLLVYAMTLFAGALTGTDFMRFISAGYVVFLPLALVMSFLLAVDTCAIHKRIIDIDYYITLEKMVNLCVPLRIANVMSEGDRGNLTFNSPFSVDVLIVAVIAVAMYALAFFLYLRRPSESATRPVIWKSAAFVFKYSTVLMGGTVFTMIFNGMFDSAFWMIVGAVIGSFITFMVVNGILNKSARAIFKGIRGFAIFMVVMLIITVVFYMDVFGIFTTIPSPSFVSGVEVNVGYELDAKYEDADAEKVTELIEKAYVSSGNFTGYPEIEYVYNVGVPSIMVDSDDTVITEAETKIRNFDIYSSHSYDRVQIRAVFHTKLGIPYAVRIMSDCEAARELVRFISDTTEKLEIPTADQINGGDAYIYIENGSMSRQMFNTYLSNEELVRYAGMLTDPLGENLSSPIVGYLNMYAKEKDPDSSGYLVKTMRFFITAKDIDVLNEMYLGDPFESEDDVIDLCIEINSIKHVYVVENDTGTNVCISDPWMVRAIVKSLCSFDPFDPNSIICMKDHGYNVFLYSNDPELMVYNHLCFRNGDMPDEVKALFEK